MNYLDHPVFLCGHRKGGTTLLINLFDSTKDAIVYPDDSNFFFKYYPRYATQQYSNDERKERLAEIIVRDNLKETISLPQYSEDTKETYLRKADELADMILASDINGFDTNDMLKLFINGFQKIFYPERKQPKLWIEKTTSTEIYALELSKIFPNAKFIHLLRDPRDNWASLSSGWEKRYQHFNDNTNRLKQSMIERCLLGMKMAEQNIKSIGVDKYKIIKFEDLTSDPEKHMKDLAKFIGLEYSSDLLCPTILGHPWKGNNFEGKKFSTPSSSNVNKWKERISKEDAKFLEFHFAEVMEKYGYERVFSSHDAQEAAINHYKWFNFSTPFSCK